MKHNPLNKVKTMKKTEPVITPLMASQIELQNTSEAYRRAQDSFLKAQNALNKAEEAYVAARVDFTQKSAEVSSKSKVQPLGAN